MLEKEVEKILVSEVKKLGGRRISGSALGTMGCRTGS